MTAFPLPGWLSALVRELERRPDCLLGGPVINGLPDNPYATATQSITTYAQQYYRIKGGNEPFFTTNNLAVSTERFRQVGGFNTSIRSATAEDREFCDRWRSYNYPMAYVPDAEVIHAHHLMLQGAYDTLQDLVLTTKVEMWPPSHRFGPRPQH